MIKGHTLIELTDVKTGKKKTFEKNNMITNGIANVFKQNPYVLGALSPAQMGFNEPLPASYSLCGGLLLFEDEITEDADNILPPSGNKMVGNGIAKFSSTETDEFGSFSATDSTFERDAQNKQMIQKFVWDFGTTQANGEISCICLASPHAGYVGFGNNDSKMIRQNVLGYQFSTQIGTLPFNSSYSDVRNLIGGDTDNSYYPALVSYPDNFIAFYKLCEFYYNSGTAYASEHITASHKLKLWKVHFPLSKINPLDLLGGANVTGATNQPWFQPYEEVDIDLPSEIYSLPVASFGYVEVMNKPDGTYFVFDASTSGQIAPNATFYVLKLNGDLTTTLYTMTNTTQSTLRKQRELSSRLMTVEDGYLIVSGTDNKVYKIKLSDSTDSAELIPPTGMVVNGFQVSDLGGRSLITVGTLNSLEAWCFADLANNKLLISNGRCEWALQNTYQNTAGNAMSVYGCKHILIRQQWNSGLQYSTTNRTTIFFNPLFLATINNLDEPVVKTSDMTMKVTYTLTCDDEDE